MHGWMHVSEEHERRKAKQKGKRIKGNAGRRLGDQRERGCYAGEMDKKVGGWLAGPGEPGDQDRNIGWLHDTNQEQCQSNGGKEYGDHMP